MSCHGFSCILRAYYGGLKLLMYPAGIQLIDKTCLKSHKKLSYLYVLV